MNEPVENDSRWYPGHPMVGVHALVFKEGRILLAKRSKEPSKGKWSIPGGRLELGETIFEAAKREVREECSVEIEIDKLLDIEDAIIRDEDGSIKYHFVVIHLLARYTGGEVKAQSDADDCRWVTPEEMARLDMPSSLRDVLKRNRIL